MRRLQSPLAVGKEQRRMPMQLPELAQDLQGIQGQRNQTILVSLGVADMHAQTLGIDIPDLQAESFAQAQPQIKGSQIKGSSLTLQHILCYTALHAKAFVFDC